MTSAGANYDYNVDDTEACTANPDNFVHTCLLNDQPGVEDDGFAIDKFEITIPSGLSQGQYAKLFTFVTVYRDYRHVAVSKCFVVRVDLPAVSSTVVTGGNPFSNVVGNAF